MHTDLCNSHPNLFSFCHHIPSHSRSLKFFHVELTVHNLQHSLYVPTPSMFASLLVQKLASLLSVLFYLLISQMVIIFSLILLYPLGVKVTFPFLTEASRAFSILFPNTYIESQWITFNMFYCSMILKLLTIFHGHFTMLFHLTISYSSLLCNFDFIQCELLICAFQPPHPFRSCL